MSKNRKVLGTEQRELKVVLSDEQICRVKDQVIEAVGEKAAHERRASEVKAELSQKGKAVDAKIAGLHELATKGYEFRAVEVERIADFDEGLIHVVRVDTGAEVDVERMSESVRQTEMDLRDATASTTTDPDADDGPWGAPVTGSAPVAELGHEVIDGEFVEDIGAANGPETPTTEQSAPESLTDAERLLQAKATLVRQLSRESAEEHLDSWEVDEVRELFTWICGEPSGRMQKRTMIPRIVEKTHPPRNDSSLPF